MAGQNQVPARAGLELRNDRREQVQRARCVRRRLRLTEGRETLLHWTPLHANRGQRFVLPSPVALHRSEAWIRTPRPRTDGDPRTARPPYLVWWSGVDSGRKLARGRGRQQLTAATASSPQARQPGLPVRLRGRVFQVQGGLGHGVLRVRSLGPHPHRREQRWSVVAKSGDEHERLTLLLTRDVFSFDEGTDDRGEVLA